MQKNYVERVEAASSVSEYVGLVREASSLLCGGGDMQAKRLNHRSQLAISIALIGSECVEESWLIAFRLLCNWTEVGGIMWQLQKGLLRALLLHRLKSQVENEEAQYKWGELRIILTDIVEEVCPKALPSFVQTAVLREELNKLHDEFTLLLASVAAEIDMKQQNEDFEQMIALTKTLNQKLLAFEFEKFVSFTIAELKRLLRQSGEVQKQQREQKALNEQQKQKQTLEKESKKRTLQVEEESESSSSSAQQRQKTTPPPTPTSSSTKMFSATPISDIKAPPAPSSPRPSSKKLVRIHADDEVTMTERGGGRSVFQKEEEGAGTTTGAEGPATPSLATKMMHTTSLPGNIELGKRAAAAGVALEEHLQQHQVLERDEVEVDVGCRGAEQQHAPPVVAASTSNKVLFVLKSVCTSLTNVLLASSEGGLGYSLAYEDVEEEE